MIVVGVISLILIIISISLLFVISLFKNNNVPKPKNDKHNFCILIPARDESSVIEDILKSIENQTHKIDMKDIYVIVESNDDPTVKICDKHNASVIVRKHLNLKSKGYALDEGIKYIESKKIKYDAYFIFDADNILDKDYIKNMIPIFDKGYDLATGYRNCKNGNESVVAASSSLTFSLINELFNKVKTKKTKNITFSGTGFYIRGYLIDKFKGYPFNSLTEDYELSCYATLNDLRTFYNTKSIFYDEQPVKYKDTINQRVRWIKGYFTVRKRYYKQILRSIKKGNPNNASKIDNGIGIIPYLLTVISVMLFFIASLIDFIINKSLILPIFILSIYLILFILTIVLLILEKDKLSINNSMKIKTLFFNPIFILSFIPCAIKALFKKEVKWTKVNHGN